MKFDFRTLCAQEEPPQEETTEEPTEEPSGSSQEANTAPATQDPQTKRDRQSALLQRPEKVIGESLNYSTIGDHVQAVQLMEDLYARYPKNMEVKVHLLRRLQSGGNYFSSKADSESGYEMYLKAGKLVREIANDLPANRLQKFKAINASTLYNEACALARTNELESSIASIRESIDWGFNDIGHLMNDRDLAMIADNPKVEAMMGDALVKFKKEFYDAAKAQLANFPAVEFNFELPGLDQQNVKISDSKGSVVVICFWTTGNVESRNNLETMKRLHRNFESKGVKIFCVGCENIKEISMAVTAVSEYMESSPVPFTTLVGNRDVRKGIKKKYGFPATLLLNSEGKLQAIFPGSLKYMGLSAVTEVLVEDAAADGADDAAAAADADGAADKSEGK